MHKLKKVELQHPVCPEALPRPHNIAVPDVRSVDEPGVGPE